MEEEEEGTREGGEWEWLREAHWMSSAIVEEEEDVVDEEREEEEADEKEEEEDDEKEEWGEGAALERICWLCCLFVMNNAPTNWKGREVDVPSRKERGNRLKARAREGRRRWWWRRRRRRRRREGRRRRREDEEIAEEEKEERSTKWETSEELRSWNKAEEAGRDADEEEEEKEDEGKRSNKEDDDAEVGEMEDEVDDEDETEEEKVDEEGRLLYFLFFEVNVLGCLWILICKWQQRNAKTTVLCIFGQISKGMFLSLSKHKK